MRYFIVTFTLVLVSVLGVAQAQPGAKGHQALVGIPETYGIRIVNTLGQPAFSPEVVFDFGTDPLGYVAAAEAPGYLVPTSVDRFADVQVSVQAGFGLPLWYVEVVATPLAYSGPVTGDGLELGDIWVEPGASSGLSQSFINPVFYGFLGEVRSSWALSESPQAIAWSAFSTGGWSSLGFNGEDYRVDVQADEDAGSYSTLVTYSLVIP